MFKKLLNCDIIVVVDEVLLWVVEWKNNRTNSNIKSILKTLYRTIYDVGEYIILRNCSMKTNQVI